MGRGAGWVAGIVACVAVGAAFARLSIGVDFADESYYVALAYRFVLGDRPFVDELHVAQTTAWIVRPFVAAYCAWTGGTEGLVLFTRRLYLLFECAVAASVFAAIRRRVEAPVAVTIALLCVAFVPFSIPNLSYNTLGSGCFTFGIFTALWASASGRHPAIFTASGALHGLAVVAYPPLLLPVAVFAAAGAALVERDRARALASHAAGVAAVGGLFAASVGAAGLVRVGEFMSARYVEDDSGRLVDVVAAWWRAGFDKRLLVAWLGLLWWQGRRRPAWIVGSLPLLPLVVSAPLWNSEAPWRASLVWMGSYGLLAPLVLPLVPRRRDLGRLVVGVWAPSFAAGATIASSSTNGSLNAGLGMVPAAIVTSIALYEALRDASQRIPSARLGWSRLVPSLLVVVVLLGFQRAVYFEDGITAPREQVAFGPFAGLWTAPDKVRLLQLLANDLEPIARDRGRIVFYDHFPAGYLLTSMRPGTPSLWDCIRLTGGEDLDLCARYYDEHRSDADVAIRIVNAQIPGVPRRSGGPRHDERMHALVTRTHDLVVARRNDAGRTMYEIYAAAPRPAGD